MSTFNFPNGIDTFAPVLINDVTVVNADHVNDLRAAITEIETALVGLTDIPYMGTTIIINTDNIKHALEKLDMHITAIEHELGLLFVDGYGDGYADSRVDTLEGEFKAHRSSQGPTDGYGYSVHGVDGYVVGTDNVQDLTNKTVDSGIAHVGPKFIARGGPADAGLHQIEVYDTLGVLSAWVDEQGNAFFRGNLAVQGTETIYNNEVIQTNLIVDGYTILGNPSQIYPTTINGNLTVSNTTTLFNSTNFLVLGPNATLGTGSGVANLNYTTTNVSGDLAVSGMLSVAGLTNLGDGSGDPLTIDGNTEIDGDLLVFGSTLLEGDVTIGNSSSDNLTVTVGNADFNIGSGNFNLIANLIVTGAITSAPLADTTYQFGNSSFSNIFTVYADSMFTGDIVLAGNFFGTGTSVLTGNLSASGDLLIAGDATFGSGSNTFTVNTGLSGLSSFSGNGSFAGSLTVGSSLTAGPGTHTLNGNTTIVGTTTITDTVSLGGGFANNAFTMVLATSYAYTAGTVTVTHSSGSNPLVGESIYISNASAMSMNGHRTVLTSGSGTFTYSESTAPTPTTGVLYFATVVQDHGGITLYQNGDISMDGKLTVKGPIDPISLEINANSTYNAVPFTMHVGPNLVYSIDASGNTKSSGDLNHNGSGTIQGSLTVNGPQVNLAAALARTAITAYTTSILFDNTGLFRVMGNLEMGNSLANLLKVHGNADISGSLILGGTVNGIDVVALSGAFTDHLAGIPYPVHQATQIAFAPSNTLMSPGNVRDAIEELTGPGWNPLVADATLKGHKDSLVAHSSDHITFTSAQFPGVNNVRSAILATVGTGWVLGSGGRTNDSLHEHLVREEAFGVGAHPATQVSYAPVSASLSSTNVQGALAQASVVLDEATVVDSESIFRTWLAPSAHTPNDKTINVRAAPNGVFVHAQVRTIVASNQIVSLAAAPATALITPWRRALIALTVGGTFSILYSSPAATQGALVDPLWTAGTSPVATVDIHYNGTGIGQIDNITSSVVKDVRSFAMGVTGGPIVGDSFDVSSINLPLPIGASVGTNTLTLGAATSTVLIPGALEIQGITGGPLFQATTGYDTDVVNGTLAIGANAAIINIGKSTTVNNIPGSLVVTGNITSNATIKANFFDVLTTNGPLSIGASVGPSRITVGGGATVTHHPGYVTTDGYFGLTGATAIIDVFTPKNFDIGLSVGANTITLGATNTNVVIPGNLSVQGAFSHFTVNTFDVEDNNITLNLGGNDASAEGGGLTITRTGTAASLVFDSTLSGGFGAGTGVHWKIGHVGSEVEVVDRTTTQNLFNKTLTSPFIAGNLLPSIDNTYDLGSTTLRWKTLHVGPGSVVVHNDTTNTNKVSLDFSGATAQVITDAATKLQLTTGANTGMWMDTSGRVGIGTSTPAASSALDVIGHAEFGSGSTRSASSANFVTSNGNGLSDEGFNIASNGVVKWFVLNRPAGDSFQISNASLDAIVIANSDGAVTFTSNIKLPTSTASAGIYYLAGTPFMHAFGTNNTFLGSGAGNLTLSGTGNVALGALSSSGLTSGNNNVSVGNTAGPTGTGTQNVVVGQNAMSSNTGNSNVALGWRAMISATGAFSNIAIGQSALSNTTGSSNIAIGQDTLIGLTSGGQNTVVGFNSGGGITTGSNNTIVGSSVNGLSAGLTNNIILANGTGAIKAQNDGTNWFLTGNVGVSTTGSPVARLQLGTTADTTAAGGINFGTDTTLYRLSAGVLKTDGSLVIAAANAQNTLQLTSTTANTGMIIGGDTNLYRSAADTLKTDDSFVVGGNVTFSGGIKLNYGTTRTANYTATTSDCVVPVDTTASGSDIAITLPASNAANSGQLIIVKDVGGATAQANKRIVIQGTGGNTIDGSATIIIDTEYFSLSFISNGSTGWIIV